MSTTTSTTSTEVRLDRHEKLISQLRLSLDSMEMSHRDTKYKYESDLANLREQISGMRREYDKLQQRYSRQSSRDKLKDSTDESDSKYLSKLEEYRQQSADWEREKQCLQQQIDALQSQNKILNDKCNLVVQTSADLKSQLDRKHELLSDTEQGLRARIKQLTTLLDQSKDTVHSQETQIGRLRSALDENYAAQRKALEDKEQTEACFRDCQRTVAKMEDEALEFRISVESHQRLVQTLQEEQSKLNQKNRQLQEVIQGKDDIIQSLQKAEEQSQSEIAQLRSEVAAVCSERDKLMIEWEKRHQDKEALNQLKCDNEKLQKELVEQQSCRESEQAEWNQHACDLQGNSAQLDAAVNERNTRIAQLEDILCTQKQNLEKLKVELQVAQCQLHACRVENQHLIRGMLPANASEAALEQLQASYKQSADALERSLWLHKEETLQLKSQLHSCRNFEVQNKELMQKIADLEQELRNKDRTNQGLGSSTEAICNLINDVNHFASRPGSAFSTPRSGYSVELGGGGTNDKSKLLMADQEHHMRKLEEHLAQHIDDLRSLTDATLYKFIPSYNSS